MQALRELAPQGDVRRLKARMRKIGLETKLPDNCAARVNRLELLNLQMRAESYEAGQKIKQLTGKSLAKTYENGYYRTIYDTAKGVGHTPAFSRLNKETVGKVLDAKNYGKNFSERIWGRSQKLGDELQEIAGTAIATGQSSLINRGNLSIFVDKEAIRKNDILLKNKGKNGHPFKYSGLINISAHIHDNTQLKPLLKQVTRQNGYQVKTIIGDGAYDAKSNYLLGRKLGIEIITPPPKNAIQHLNTGWHHQWYDTSGWEERNQAIRHIEELGIDDWIANTDYHRRSLVENAFYRLKTIFSERLKFRTEDNQLTEQKLRVMIINKFNQLGLPKYNTTT